LVKHAGLLYLHGRGIAHRDVKPDNLLMYENGTLRIADFGCAVQFPPGTVRTEGLLRDTSSGTYTFYAPECVTGEPFCAYSADVWAAGVTLYTWIFGEIPFSGAYSVCVIICVIIVPVFEAGVTLSCQRRAGSIRFSFCVYQYR
jgi:serine/threonine protein kinase